MRFSKVLIVCAALGFVAPAHANCFVCDEVVELTSDYATCYSENFDILIAALEASAVDRQQINLAGCNGGQDAASNRGGLLEMGALPAAGQASVKSVYILDRASAICLRDLIVAHDAAYDPSAVFRLGEVCADE